MIGDAALSGTGTNVINWAGLNSLDSVGTFTDANPSAALSELAVSTNWGNGLRDETFGSVVGLGNSTIEVDGDHSNCTPGDYPISVTVLNAGGASTSFASAPDILVPEPSSVLVLISGLAGLFASRRARRAAVNT
jgi:hypothetical protein